MVVSKSLKLVEIEIIVVDERFRTLMSDKFSGCFAVERNAAYYYGISIGIDDADNVVLFEVSFDTGDSNRQYTDGLLRVDRLHGSAIDMLFSFGESLGVGDPTFNARYGVGRGNESRANRRAVFP